jgi:predicted transposase YdaD
LVRVVLADGILVAAVAAVAVCFTRRVSPFRLERILSQLRLRRLWEVLAQRRQSVACILPLAVRLAVRSSAADTARTVAEILAFQHHHLTTQLMLVDLA